MPVFYKIVTAKAPVNIAVIKYWGKSEEDLKLPVNDSLSGTIDLNDLCTTTSAAISDTYQDHRFWLNGVEQKIDDKHLLITIIAIIRDHLLEKRDIKIPDHKLHIVSYNNFPTAAGLASSAAGYACLAFVLGHLYGVTDLTELSKIARRGSGSACRSLYGGFVQWHKGFDHESSLARQVVPHDHWTEMRVLICVVSDHRKDVSSSRGMLKSVETSSLLKYRIQTVVPERIDKIKNAINDKDFQTFADITMQDSNQFHAICLDTYPPLFYLNEASRQIIRFCTFINNHFGKNMVAYTFDAGPNACIYTLDSFVNQFIHLVQVFFPSKSGTSLEIKGRPLEEVSIADQESCVKVLSELGLSKMPDAISYLINTSVGEGPKLMDEHIDDKNLKP